MTGRDRGALALVLHTHMPYVEGFGTWPFGEEWLWEAVASVYLPLLEPLAEAPVTLSLTPVLCDQLEAMRGRGDGPREAAAGGGQAPPAAAEGEASPGERYLRFLNDVRAPIHAEDAAGLDATGKPVLAAELRRAAADYVFAAEEFERRGRDLVRAFAGLGAELWTSTASHAVLPMLATDAGIRLQVAAGVASHERRFGEDWTGGFWLPECAFEPGLERDLAEHGVRAFCVDQTDSLGLGSLDQLEPVETEAGPVAVPIDWQTVGLVWGSEAGYPAHPDYRDYHGRTLHDLKPWSTGGGPYDRDRAVALARAHARDFVERAVARLDAYAAERRRPGLLCCALDTELLGHWWYEGPVWLAGVLEEARAAGLELVTLPAGLERVEPVRRELAASTWGSPKDLSTWDSARVADVAFAARAAELATVAAAAGAPAGGAGGGSAPGGAAAGAFAPGGSAVRNPALQRAARELFALQASDWAFLLTRDLAADYPLERVRGHAAALREALAALDSPRQPDPALRSLAPELDLAPLVSP
jgi:1,4-alpha-glucan branching enzyme